MKFSVDHIPDQKGKVAIVTGGNSGIGFETVRALALKGARVIMASRNAAKGAAAKSEILKSVPHAVIELMDLDLSDLESVKRFAENFGNRHEKLDVLVNNAGVMFPPFAKTRQGFELTFATNHLGHFALTGHLLPMLSSGQNSRIVNVSSLAHRSGKIDYQNLNAEKKYSKLAAYSQSKLANLLFTFELERRLRKNNTKLMALASHPGWTVTNLQVHTKVFSFLNPFFGQGPAEGALPSLFAATADGVKSGEYFGPGGFMEIKGAPKRVQSVSRAQDPELARRLWDISQELTEVAFLN